MQYYISITIARKGGVIFTDRDIATRGLIIIRNFGTDLLGILYLLIGSSALFHAVNNPVMIIKLFQPPFTIILGLVELVNRNISFAQVYYQNLLPGFLVGPLYKAGISTVRHILTLNNSRLLA